jgi:hypothetical protein
VKVTQETVAQSDHAHQTTAAWYHVVQMTRDSSATIVLPTPVLHDAGSTTSEGLFTPAMLQIPSSPFVRAVQDAGYLRYLQESQQIVFASFGGHHVNSGDPTRVSLSSAPAMPLQFMPYREYLSLRHPD